MAIHWFLFKLISDLSPAQVATVPLNGDASASQDKVEKLSGPLLEEFLHIKVRHVIFIVIAIIIIIVMRSPGFPHIVNCNLNGFYSSVS